MAKDNSPHTDKTKAVADIVEEYIDKLLYGEVVIAKEQGGGCTINLIHADADAGHRWKLRPALPSCPPLATQTPLQPVLTLSPQTEPQLLSRTQAPRLQLSPVLTPANNKPFTALKSTFTNISPIPIPIASACTRIELAHTQQTRGYLEQSQNASQRYVSSVESQILCSNTWVDARAEICEIFECK